MPALALPYEPLRTTTYSPSELFSGFSSGDPSTYLELPDFKIYRHFVAEGRSTPAHYFTSMMEALHDNSITQSLSSLIIAKKCVAIMGGHKLGRTTTEFAQVAELARQLARSGFIIASGGGPGAMEAAHLGAAACNESDGFLDDAIATLSKVPDLPSNIADIVAPDGTANLAITRAAHAWFAPAMEFASRIKKLGVSLAVPTWHYGHEPTTPFASHIAKYFQNSIREDGLLALAGDGIVFAQGKAGTIQEIFQDAAQNYYKSFGRFSPMVFLDKAYWTGQFPVDSVLRSLFKPDDYAKYVLFTNDINEAHHFLVSGHW